MNKYLFAAMTMSTVIITLFYPTRRNTEKSNDMILLNIECLADTEKRDIVCYFSGSIDCPVSKEKVKFYW